MGKTHYQSKIEQKWINNVIAWWLLNEYWVWVFKNEYSEIWMGMC